MYLFAIIDLYIRYIVNWGLFNTMLAECWATIREETILIFDKPEIFNTV